MNALETYFNEEVAKKNATRKTVKQLQDEQRTKAIDFCNEMVDKLSFLSKFGCKVYIDKMCGYGRFFIDYPDGHGINGTRTAELSLKKERRKYDDQDYSYFYAEEKFYVNWNYRICHNDKDEYLATEGIVRHLARIIG